MISALFAAKVKPKSALWRNLIKVPLALMSVN